MKQKKKKKKKKKNGRLQIAFNAWPCALSGDPLIHHQSWSADDPNIFYLHFPREGERNRYLKRFGRVTCKEFFIMCNFFFFLVFRDRLIAMIRASLKPSRMSNGQKVSNDILHPYRLRLDRKIKNKKKVKTELIHI